MPISQIQQLEMTKQQLLALKDLQSHPSWGVFEKWIMARHDGILEGVTSIDNQDHLLQVASKAIYQQALRALITDLNALDVTIQAISQEIDCLI